MIRFAIALSIALTCCQVVARPAVAQDCVDYAAYAHLIGESAHQSWNRDIAIAGHHAFVPVDYLDLLVFDLNEPATPAVVGSVDIWGTKVEVAGDHLFVLGHAGGVRIYDISTPTTPVFVAGVDVDGYLDDFAVSGDVVHVLSRPSDPDLPAVLSVIDAAVPAQPVVLGTFEFPGRGRILNVDDGWVYYLDAQQNMHIYELASPTELLLRHVVPLGMQARSLHVEDGLALVGGRELVVVALDHEDGIPAVVGRLDFPGYYGTGYGIDLVGSVAHVAASTAGFMLVDLADPADPRIVAITGEETNGGQVIVRDGLAFVAGHGISVFDVSGPLAPPVLGSLAELEEALELIIAGDLVYAAARHQRLVIAGVTDSGELQVIGSCATQGDVRDVAVVGDLVAMTSFRNTGLELVDTSDPAQPVLVGSLAVPYHDIHDLALTTTHAYVLRGTEGYDYWFSSILIVDVTDPTAPAVAEGFALPQRTTAITVADGLLYVGGYYPHVHVFSLADPVAPQFVATVPAPDTGGSLLVRDELLLTCGQGLGVLSLADPLAPQLLSSLDMPWSVQNVDVRGGTAYVAALQGGLQVIDLMDPEHPVVIGQANGPWEARGIGLLGDRVLVTGASGLLAYPVQCPGTVSIEVVEDAEVIPHAVVELTAWPNPFNPRTTVVFDLPRPDRVRVAVFDLRGRLVRMLVEGDVPAGTHEVIWEGSDARGRAVPSGTYLLRLDTDAASRSRKIMLVR